MLTYTNDQLISLIQQQNSYMTMAEWDKKFNNNPSAQVITNRFHGWPAAWKVAGFPVHNDKYRTKSYSDEYLLSLLKKQGKFINQEEWNRTVEKPTAQCVASRFGGWKAAWTAAVNWNQESGRDEMLMPPAYETKEELLELLRSKGRIISVREWRRTPGLPTEGHIVSVFGNWRNAWIAAGYDETLIGKRFPKWSKETIISALKSEGQYMTLSEWDACKKEPSSGVIVLRFGKWLDAWLAAGVPIPYMKNGKYIPPRKRYSDDDLIRLLKQHGYMSVSDWNSTVKLPKAKTVIERLGSWRKAWKQAGYIVPNNGGPKGLSREAVIGIMQQQESFLTMLEWRNRNLHPCDKTIRAYFGTWEEAWKAAGFEVSK